jgi:hypothetical protein
MEEVHHKGSFPGDLKGSNSKISQAYSPYLGHLLVRSRSRKGIEDNKVIVVLVRDNKQFAT